MLNLSSTTEPIRRCIGSVVELLFNKSVVMRVRMVGPAVLACFKLFLFPTSTLPSFTLLATLAFLLRHSAGKYVIFVLQQELNLCWESNPVSLVWYCLALPLSHTMSYWLSGRARV